MYSYTTLTGKQPEPLLTRVSLKLLQQTLIIENRTQLPSHQSSVNETDLNCPYTGRRYRTAPKPLIRRKGGISSLWTPALTRNNKIILLRHLNYQPSLGVVFSLLFSTLYP
jgi:hypothetical protein